MLLAIYKWFVRTCLSCQDATHLVSEACERELTFMEKVKLKILCYMCPYTDRYDKQVNLMHEKLGNCCEEIGEKSVSVCLSDDCKDRIKAKMGIGE